MPRSLPKIRDQVVRHLTDPSMPLRSQTREENRVALDLTADHLRKAGLYWVTADMTALAVSAGGSLGGARWATEDRPSSSGLLVWDGGAGTVDVHGLELPVDAVTWGPAPQGCMIGFWTLRTRIGAAITQLGKNLDADQVPPLVPSIGTILPVTGEPIPSMTGLPNVMPGAIDVAPEPVVAALAAAWLLMQQPNLVQRSIERPDKAVRRAYGRAGRENPEVSVIDLRHQYVPEDSDLSDDPASRHYKVRWVVSGHWRNQAYGPNRELRRRQWVPSYVKGPDGAPLMVTEKVNVWRR